MARDAAQWLARKELLCRTVTIKVRYSDFTTVTRSHSAAPTRDAEDLAQRAVALLDKTEAGRRPVRLLGASVHNLIDPDMPTEEPWLPFDEEAPGAVESAGSHRCVRLRRFAVASAKAEDPAARCHSDGGVLRARDVRGRAAPLRARGAAGSFFAALG